MCQKLTVSNTQRQRVSCESFAAQHCVQRTGLVRAPLMQLVIVMIVPLAVTRCITSPAANARPLGRPRKDNMPAINVTQMSKPVRGGVGYMATCSNCNRRNRLSQHQAKYYVPDARGMAWAMICKCGETCAVDVSAQHSVEPTECTECCSPLPAHFAGCSRFPD